VPVPYADFGDPQTLNLYQFVGGNPASKADPDGHQEIDPERAERFGDSIARNTEAVIRALKSVGSFLDRANAALAPQNHTPFPSPPNCPQPESKTQDSKQNNNNSQSSNTAEQGRDAQGKFTSKQPGQSAPGAAAEKEG
jgi:hypothetical protein